MSEEVQQQQQTVTPAAQPVVDLDSISHDDYRALREARKPVEAAVTPKPSAGSSEEEETKTDADSETANTEDQEHEQQQPKKKGGFQKRIDKLTREKAELEARLAGQTPAAKPAEVAKPEPVKAAETGKPESRNFETYEGYVEALTDWKLEQKDVAKAKAAADVEAAKTAKSNADKWNEQLKDARSRYDDFDEIALADVPISEAVHNAIVTTEHGADLAYFLGQNPAERERINKLAPVAATLALGRIMASIEAEASASDDATDETPVDKKPKVSAAPPPIRPLGSKSATAGKRIDDMTSDEFRKARESGKIR
jgi:hypothetical protein